MTKLITLTLLALSFNALALTDRNCGLEIQNDQILADSVSKKINSALNKKLQDFLTSRGVSYQMDQTEVRIDTLLYGKWLALSNMPVARTEKSRIELFVGNQMKVEINKVPTYDKEGIPYEQECQVNLINIWVMNKTYNTNFAKLESIVVTY